MNLNTSEWKTFAISNYFDVVAGNYHYSDEYTCGETPYVTASNINNGIAEYIDLEPEFKGNCITTGKVGCTAFYQPNNFCATSDVNILIPKFNLSANIGLFIARIINYNENYRWTYGRQCRVGNTKNIKIKLPVNSDGDPDFEWIEAYMNTLHNKPITTKNRNGDKIPLDTKQWQSFLLHQLFDANMGSGIDAVATTQNCPSINYVGRRGDNNGVMNVVDRIEDVEPFPAGSITLALGGSLGACFVQPKQFYTSQNVAVLSEKEPLTTKVKLFITSIISNECKLKYQAFGRELNSHFRKDFTLKLPVLLNPDGTPKIDTTCKYSERGFIPDWGYMEKYMGSLSYGDRL